MTTTIENKVKNKPVGQSLYIQNVASLNSGINNHNEGKKFDSYARYLMRKKGIIFSKDTLSISKQSSTCDFCG